MQQYIFLHFDIIDLYICPCFSQHHTTSTYEVVTIAVISEQCVAWFGW